MRVEQRRHRGLSPASGRTHMALGATSGV